jgi:hypothetical protein
VIACWFASQVLPGEHNYGLLRNEDGTTATLWRPCLQLDAHVLPLMTAFRCKEDCEKFIREEIATATIDAAARP